MVIGEQKEAYEIDKDKTWMGKHKGKGVLSNNIQVWGYG